MKPYDALFLSLALTYIQPNDKKVYLIGIVGIIAYLVTFLNFGKLELPLLAVSVLFILPDFAPAALILLIPEYPSFTEAVITFAIWPTALFLLKSQKLNSFDPCSRKVTEHFFILGVLYFIFMPLRYL